MVWISETLISIYDHDGEIWIGGQSGLELFEQGHFRRFQLAGSEPLRGVSGIVLAKKRRPLAESSIWR